MNINDLLANFCYADGNALERMIREVQIIGERISFTALGAELGCFPNLRKVTAKNVFPEHHHDFFELSFILDGSGTHTAGGNRYTVRQGDVFFLNNELPHRYIVSKNEHLTVLNFAFVPEYLERNVTFEKLRGGLHFFLVEPFFRQLDNARDKLTLTGPSFFRTASIGLCALDAFNRSYPAKSDLMQHLFKAYIMSINEAFEEKLDSAPGFHERREKLFRDIITFIDARLAEKISLASISEAVGLGRTRLAEVFKDRQGETIVEYINRKRVEQAQELLRTTDMPVIDIALETGFGDISNFNRTFKKTAGVSPRDFRRNA